jgi:integrase
MSRRTPGVRPVHRTGCPARSDERCRCAPTWQADVYDGSGRRVRRNFPSEAAAKTWRIDALRAARLHPRGGAIPRTVREAAEDLVTGMRTGAVRTRSGAPYKPSVCRSYEQVFNTHLLPRFGGCRLADLSPVAIQALIDDLMAAHTSPSTVRNVIVPLRVLFRRALRNSEVTRNPTEHLDLPTSQGRRERIADPAEAAALIALLPRADKALWATALYAGLRRGELMALEWANIDLDEAVLHVSGSWDIQAGRVEPKSKAGRRKVPIPTALRKHLVEHQLRSAWSDGLAFGRTSTQAFNPSTSQARADRAWKNAGQSRITLHEARHTYASLMIAAGVNAHTLATYMGHASITVTLDRYGHLMPGNEAQAAALLDAYLDR